MRHAILGAGGVGGLIGGALARAGHDVLLILRPQALDGYPGGLRVESQVLGDFDVDVPAAARLDRPVDVLWVTVKATQLEAALALAAPAVAGEALVLPLLNGIDHVARLRAVYGEVVVAGAIRVEAERVGSAHIVQPGGFAAAELGPRAALGSRAETVAAELSGAGLPTTVRPGGEAAVLWSKLALLCPMALGTTAAQLPLGGVREYRELFRLVLDCATEVCAIAATEGADVDPERCRAALEGAPPEMRTSMQKDLAAGRPLELDFIAGPVVRRGRERAIPTPATEELVRRVAANQDGL